VHGHDVNENKGLYEKCRPYKRLRDRDWSRQSAHVHIHAIVLPTGRTSFLKHTQELRLHFERQLSNFIQKNRSPLAA